MKIAIYKEIKYQFPTIVSEKVSGQYDKDPSYVRISEFVDVEFPMLSKAAYAEAFINALDEEARQARLELANRLSSIEQRKAEFMAITHEVEP